MDNSARVGGTDQREDATAGVGHERKLGLFAASMAVVASIVGAGIFSLPRILGPFGVACLVGLALAALGAMAVGLVFGALARRDGAAHGPVSYADSAFGRATAFATAWFFWLVAICSGGALAAALSIFLEQLIGADFATWQIILIGLFGTWLPIGINMFGSNIASRVGMVATLLTITVLAFLIIFGLFKVNATDLGPFNATNDAILPVILQTIVLSVFSFSGVESVAVLSDRISNPRRNVMRASLIGVAICGLVYLLSVFVVLGTVQDEDRRSGLASFSLSLNNILHTTYGGKVVALAATAATVAAGIMYAMMGATTARVAANMDLFPRRFARVSKKHEVPVFAMVVGGFTTIAILTLFRVGDEHEEILQKAVILVGIASAVTFLVCGAAAIKWALKDRGQGAPWWEAAAGAISIVFALIIAIGSLAVGQVVSVTAAVIWTILGLVAYVLIERERRRPESLNNS